MEIRKIQPEEIAAVRAICFLAFEKNIDFTESPERSAEQILHSPLTRMHQNYTETWAAFNEENEPIATAAHCTAKVKLDDSEVKLEEIGDVASLPQAQGKGTVRVLFQKILQEAYEKGVELSGLYPFSDGYYAHLGYSNCVKNHIWKLALNQIPRWETTGICKPYQAGHEMEKDLEQVYKKAAEGYNLSIIREKPEWQRQLMLLLPYRDGFYTYIYYNKEGLAAGYLSYQINRTSGMLDCKQFFYTDVDSLKGLLMFLKGKAAYYGAAQIPLPSSVPLEWMLQEFHLNTPQSSGYSMEMHGMTRIVHLQRALKAVRFGQDGQLRLKITDPLLVQNNGTFEIAWKNNRLCLFEKSSLPADAELSIGQLTRFVCTGLREEECALMPEFSPDVLSRLETAFPPKKTATFDYY